LEDSENKSVSLDDSTLGQLKLKMQMGMSGKVFDTFVCNAIQDAEKEHDLEQQPQQEEYESLVLGSSIWSTDIRKESKHEFIEGIKNQQSSDIGGHLHFDPEPIIEENEFD